jgi:transposase-like protein DUF772
MMTGFERYTKQTKRALFTGGDGAGGAPWRELCALIEPHCPKAGNGRPPVGVERMLRIYFLQQWFNLSDPGVEEALCDSAVLAIPPMSKMYFFWSGNGRPETEVRGWRRSLEHVHTAADLKRNGKKLRAPCCGTRLRLRT